MKRISLKYKSMSLCFLILVFCLNYSCLNQSNKFMNINETENNIKNKKIKNNEFDLKYKKIMKNYKKKELINNKKFVKSYFGNKQYVDVDCLIQLIAKYLENWNYKLQKLFNESLCKGLSINQNYRKNAIDLLKEIYIAPISPIDYLRNNNNMAVLKSDPWNLLQFLNMAKEYQRTNTKVINDKSNNLKKKDNVLGDYACNYFVYEIIYSFLKLLHLEDYDTNELGIIFINSLNKKEIYLLLCIELNEVEKELKKFLYTHNNVLSITLSNQYCFFSELYGKYIISSNIKNFIKQYRNLSMVLKNDVPNKEYLHDTLVVRLMQNFICTLLEKRQYHKELVLGIVSKNK